MYWLGIDDEPWWRNVPSLSGLAAFVDVFASDSAHLLKLQLKIATLVGDLVAEHHTVAFHSGKKKLLKSVKNRIA